VNYRGIKPSGIFQNVMTFGLLLTFAVFTLLGFARGSSSNLRPLFSHAGTAGAWLSIFLVLQIVPYFMTGFESVAKGSEEAHEGFDPRNFAKAIYAALVAGFLFYVIIIAVVTWVYPWQEIVTGHVRTEVAFERTFGSHAIAQLILFGAFLSLLKIFNGNFVAGTRMMYAMGKRGVVHRSLGLVHPTYGTPAVAISLLAALTMVCAMMGDAILVPITEVGSLTAGIGWLSACAALILRARAHATRTDPSHPTHLTHATPLPHAAHPTHPTYPTSTAWLGAAVSLAIVLMKVIPEVPGSFTRAEWIAFAAWSGAGFVFWRLRPSPTR
jgi:amino acid transporter